ncbi:MAG: hypothetical protein U9N84_03675 [Actinomycetota bacterium]|nr:hypothetical protein [Actinomycetota bacterium]
MSIFNGTRNRAQRGCDDNAETIRWRADVAHGYLGHGIDEIDGNKVYDRIKRAVDKLMEVKDAPAPITTARDELVGFSRDVAQAKIDEAGAEGGDAAKIAEALAKMTKAEEKVAKGEYDRAIDEFKKAWESAWAAFLRPTSAVEDVERTADVGLGVVEVDRQPDHAPAARNVNSGPL